jgi:uncharacterized membrane protein
MAHVTLTEHVDAPVERVFEMFIDVGRWPEWMPNATEIKEITGPLDMVGTKIHTVSGFLGRTMESWEEVVEADRPRLWKIRTEASGMKGTATYRLTPVARGTDVAVEADYELSAGFLGHIADRLFLEKTMERQMRHAGENLKALIEAEVSVPV